jgi:hypothetical protein
MKVPRALGALIGSYRGATALFVVLGFLPGGCVYDSSNRCGPHQVIYGDPAVCVCDTKSVQTATGCTPCGEHEVPSPTGCVCEPGYGKPTPSEACVEVPMGLGAPCSTASACADPTYNYCAVGADGSGYCTTGGCTAPEDCTGGYACNMSGTQSYCERPPVGAGVSCMSDADCAGTEATYCDTFVQHACLVQGCTVMPNNCFAGTECCDLSSFGIPQPICIPAGACMQ